MTADEFRRLADQWHDETGFLSNPSDICSHPAYRTIIDAGESVVPWIFEDLRTAGGDWFEALRAITGGGPEIPPEQHGRWSYLREAWMDWGRVNGIWAGAHGGAHGAPLEE